MIENIMHFTEKIGGVAVEAQNEVPSSSKPNKAKTTKAERRALQESQRAAKAAAKGSNSALSYSYIFLFA